MNERIRKLYVKAAYVECPDGLFPRETFDYEKFAELIIRECAQFCEDKNSKLLGTMLKEHFGVEE